MKRHLLREMLEIDRQDAVAAARPHAVLLKARTQVLPKQKGVSSSCSRSEWSKQYSHVVYWPSLHQSSLQFHCVDHITSPQLPAEICTY